MKNLKYILSTLQGINRNFVIVLVLAFAFTACGYEDPWSPYKSKASISYTLLNYQSAVLSGNTTGKPTLTWSLQVLEGEEFCSALTQSGRVGSPFSLKFEANSGDTERTAVANITFSDGFSKSFTIRQLAKTENPEYDRAWGEQPDYREGSALVYKTYYTSVGGGKSVRNFSICYDTDKLVSHWVAYPLHSSYLGNVGRTDEWSFDDYYYTQSGSGYIAEYIPTNPVIPELQQQDIVYSAYGTGDNRGHMLPSASRQLNYNMNAQTFYATNMMPQNGRFNSGSWLSLENAVRGWIKPDTLYVVTGTLFESGSYQFTSKGRKITRPSHAYKVLLRTKEGNSGKRISEIKSADELMCIGFVFENNATDADTTLKEAAVSVSEIELRSGFVFFRNLQPEIADEVKQQKNLKDWGL